MKKIIMLAICFFNLNLNAQIAMIILGSPNGRFNDYTSYSNVNIKDKNEEIPLMFATWHGHTEAVKQLINAGYDINIKNNYGNTALILASMFGYTEIAKELIKASANLNIQDEGDSTALIQASVSGHTEIVKELINEGADVNIQNINGDTALIWASFNGHTEIVKELIKAGANLNIQNNYGYTALIEASESGHTEIAKKLIKAGANLNIQNNHGYTALIEASFKGYTEIVKELIKAGANLNIQNNHGYTALMKATGHTKIVKLLRAVIEVKQNINKFKNQSKEIKNILIERWINLKEFDKINLIKAYSPFYKLYFDIYKQILSGDISTQEIKKILTGEAKISILVKKNSGFFAKLNTLLTLSKKHSIHKSSYYSLRKDLARVYELNKKGIPKEVIANILAYNNIRFKYCEFE